MLSKADQIAAGIIMALLVIGCIVENWRDRKRGMADNGVAGLLWAVAAMLVAILLIAAFTSPRTLLGALT